MNKHISIYIILFLSLAFLTTATTINSVIVDPSEDIFYSSYSGNNVVNLIADVTADSTVASVTADFSDLGFYCAGQTGYKINLVNSSDNLWKGSCDVSNAAAVNVFKSGQVRIDAVDSDNRTAEQKNIIIVLYNLTIPTGTSDGCYKFGPDSTNFAQETNFDSFINGAVKLVIQANDNPACTAPGYSWSVTDHWLTVGQITFNDVKFNNNYADAQKLSQLANIVKMKFSSSKTYQNSGISVDVSQMPELNVHTIEVKMYHLSFITPGKILNNGAPIVSTWFSNSSDNILNTTTYIVTFNPSYPVSGGYSAVDDVPPTISIISPTSGYNFTSTSVSISALINGTGTEVSQALFYINNNSNTANCILISADLFNCSLTTTLGDGSYNLTVVGFDYGGAFGNNASSSTRLFIVQTGAPTLTTTTPTNGATYTSVAGSMLKLVFGATDGNGISSCKYSLSGPTTATDVAITNCTSNTIVQLYLSAGAYNLTLSATDGSGMITVSNISFTVTDTTAPVITNNSTNPTSNNALLSVNTDESATCKYDTVDLPYADMRKTFKNNVSKHNVTLELDKDKVYDYYVRCLDLSSNANKESLQVTLVYGTAPVENKTVVKVDPTDTYDLGTLPVGTKVVSVDKAGIPILSLIITTTKLANDVSLKLTTVSKPEETYSEKVYKYITIEHAALSDDSISNVKIKFSVDKKWLTDNNINKSDVVLVRYGANGWTALNTNLTRESDDGTEIFYLADSPGLSLFAISKTIPPVVTITPITTTVLNTTNVTTNTTSTDTDLLQKRHINWFWVILVSVIIFILIVLFVLVQKNDRDSPPIFPEDRTPWGRVRRLFK